MVITNGNGTKVSNKLFDQHVKEDDRRFGDITNSIKEINKLLTNHYTDMSRDITEMRTDMSWIKRFFWIFATVTVSSIATAFFALIIK